jgi:hypothetical protein
MNRPLRVRLLKRWERALVPALAALLSMGHLQADPAEDRPTLAVTAIDRAPAWDKALTDPIWQQAWVTSVSLQAPSNVTYSVSPEKTQVRALWSPDYLLVRFDCEDRSVVSLPGRDGTSRQRDLPYFKADAVEIFLDPVGDGRMYMEFQISPDNGVFDAIYLCTTTPRSGPTFMLDADVVNRDLFFIPEWNLAGLQTAATVWPASQGRGWSAAAAIPAKEILKRLGKTEFSPSMKMRINFVRFDYDTVGAKVFAVTNWAPVLGGCAHISPAGMGTIILAPKP